VAIRATEEVSKTQLLHTEQIIPTMAKNQQNGGLVTSGLSHIQHTLAKESGKREEARERAGEPPSNAIVYLSQYPLFKLNFLPADIRCQLFVWLLFEIFSTGTSANSK